ncbi:AEC family transporter [Scopulibacillus darangshiensis]|nr:AEC family transporter [Scopulibacillus darangshiensis]
MAFLEILLPIFGIFGIGYVGQKTIGFDTKTLSTMALYLMTPFLAFHTFYESKFNVTYGYLLIYTIVLCFSLIGIVHIVSAIRGFSKKETCGMILASAFMNNGNYGTPLVLFVFGKEGLHYAIILMVIQSLLMCTVGIYYAAKGSPNNDGLKASLGAVLRMPIAYGALAGALFQWFHIEVNHTIMDAVAMVGDAAIPTIMIVLGMQLANISIKKLAIHKISLSLVIKLLLSPAIALLLAFILPIDDLLQKIMILMAAMPTAANTTMYALQYQTEPEFVSSATLVSTVLSLVTLPLVLIGIQFI